MPETISAPDAVRALLAIPFLLMGASHIVQPAMWRDYFVRLRSEGTPAVVTRTFSLELWPALLIVVFHRVWTWPAVLLTAYGHLLLIKIVLSLLVPSIGLRSLGLADKNDNSFRVGGVILVAFGVLCLTLP